VTTAANASTAASTALTRVNTYVHNGSSPQGDGLNGNPQGLAYAINTAATSLSNSNTAITTANTANNKADQAINAVSNSINYQLVANVAAIPASPANNTYIEVQDTTGLQSFTPLTGLPAGYLGDAGLSARLRFTTSPSTWTFLNYYANNPETRYLRLGGGTLTGNVVFANTQPTATTAAAGIVQLTDSTSSTSNTTAATPSSVKLAYDIAAAALAKAGGTMTGDITFSGTQTFPGTFASSGGAITGDVTLNAQKNLRFADSDSSNWVGFQAPATIASDVIWTLPSSDATVAGQFLSSNAAGVLSWATPSAGIASISATSPLSSTGGATPTISVQDGTTSQKGVLQLTDSVTSTSTTTAATPAAVKAAFDLANIALPTSGGTMSGSITFVAAQTYPRIPQNSQGTTYTLVAGDSGKHISTTSTVIVNSSVFTVGDAVSIYNNSSNNISIIQGGSATLRLAGTSTTGTRTLAQRGVATVLCVASDEFVVSGGGLT